MSNNEDDIWGDDVDDDFFHQVSQMVETKQSQDEKMDEAEMESLRKALEDDDDFFVEDDSSKRGQTVEGVPSYSQNRLKQKETVFNFGNVNPNPSGVHPSPQTFRKPDPRPSHLNPNNAVTNFETSKLRLEIEKLSAQVKKLNEEKCQKHGETVFLRAELERKEKAIKTKALEAKHELELKDEEIRRSQAQAKQEIDAVKAEKEFLAQDIRSLRESLKRFEANGHVGNGDTSKMSTTFKRPLENPTFSQKPKRRASEILPKGIDESFLGPGMVSNRNGNEKKPVKRVKCVETAAQTTPLLMGRRHQFPLRHLRSNNLDNISSFASILSRSKAIASKDPKTVMRLLSVSAEPENVEKIKQRMIEEDIKSFCKEVDSFCVSPTATAEGWIHGLLESIAIFANSGKSGLRLSVDEVAEFGKAMSSALKTEKLQAAHAKIYSVMTALVATGSISLLSQIQTFLAVFDSEFDHKQPSQRYLAAQNSLRILKHVSNFAWSGVALCRGEKGSCFVTKLCSVLFQMTDPRKKSYSMNDDDHLTLSTDFVMWIKSAIAAPHTVSWVGRSSQSSCQTCRVVVVRTMVHLLCKVIRLIGFHGVKDPKVYSTTRSGLQCLHLLWATDHNFTAEVMGEKRILQEYMWMMGQLDRIKPSLNMYSFEASAIITDLQGEIQ